MVLEKVRNLALNPRQIHKTLSISKRISDLILFVAVAVAADFHVGELRDEVDVLLAVGAVEALVGARLGVQHRLDQAGVRADLQGGVLYQAARSSCSLVCACGHTGLFIRSDTWVVWTWIWDIPTSFLGSSHLQ